MKIQPLILLMACALLAAACTEPIEPTPKIHHDYDLHSGIEAQPLSAVQVSNLALLARVWGFAKYHHPLVIGGEGNWDFELFRVMPHVLAAADRPAAAAALVEWLDEQGTFVECSPCAQLSGNLHLSPEIGWIEDAAGLSAALSTRLKAIHRNRPRDGAQRYVSPRPNVANPEFEGERNYPQQSGMDAGYRMLALFRYWNVIQYWFPYRDVMDAHWLDVLHEFIPVMMQAEGADAYRLALMRLTARIDDTHARLEGPSVVYPPDGQSFLPFVLRFVEGKLVVRGLFDELGPLSGLQAGDVIEEIDGIPVATLVEAWRPFFSLSNEASLRWTMAKRFSIGEGPALLSGSGAQGPFTRTVTRYRIVSGFGGVRLTHDLPGPAFQWLADEVAYLKLSEMVGTDVSSYAEQVQGATVLVIDVRNYPTDNLAGTFAGHLVAAPTPYTSITRADYANPGAFRWTGPTFVAPREPRFDGKVVILVDELTISAAEFHAMVFRAAPDAIVVGSMTSGADGNVSYLPLPGGLRTTFSGIGIFYPDRTPTQRVGIVPDLNVMPTIAGMRAGRDEVLEAGVSHALGREFRLSRD